MPVPERDGVCVPQIQRDIEDYLSPVTGEVIRSRSGQRDDLKRHDCVLKPPRKTPFQPRSPKIRAQLGLGPLKE